MVTQYCLDFPMTDREALALAMSMTGCWRILSMSERQDLYMKAQQMMAVQRKKEAPRA